MNEYMDSPNSNRVERKKWMDQQMNVGSNERWKIEMLNETKLA